jgi:zinc protease
MMVSCAKKREFSLRNFAHLSRKTGRWAAFGLLWMALTSGAVGQSGRGRTPNTPPPQPKPKPNAPMVTTVLGIPEGGKLKKQELDNLTSRFLLRNDLTILIRERHSAPLVAIQIAVRAGRIHEADDQAGLATLLRKAILKGSATRNATAIDREVARLGGVLTSSTGVDATIFNLMIPAESYQAGIEMLADMLLKPAFNAPAFSAEDVKRAATETLIEAKQAQDQARESILEKLYAAAFTSNPARRGRTVSESMLQSVTREKVLAFYQQHYLPKNVLVTVVGDVFSLRALGQIQLNFGDFKTAAPGAGAPSVDQSAIRGSQSAIEESPQDKLRYANARADLGQSHIAIGYRVPVIKTDKEGLKEWATLEMLTMILGGGNGSRLGQGLREGQASRDKTSVVYEAGAQMQVLPDAGRMMGMLVAKLRVDPNRIDRAEAEFFREIERLRREVIGEGEFLRARALFEKQYYDAISKFELEAEILSQYQMRFGDFKLFDSMPALIRAVTAQGVQQAASKYLTLANATVQELEPLKAAPRSFTPEKFAELAVTFEPKAGQPVRPEEVKPAVALKIFPQGPERSQATEGQNIIIATAPLPVRDYSVLRGPRAYVREDKTLPTLSIGVYFQGGRLIEDQATSGMTELMLRSMLKSTTTRKGDLIAQELESYGGEIQIVNEADFYGFSLNVLSRNAENAVKVMLEIIENPYFDKVEIAREREILLADQISSRDDSSRRAAELMWASIYPGHPYGLPRFGLPEPIKSATDEKLEAWYAKTIKRQYPLLILVGDTDGSALVSRIFSDGLKRGDLDKTLKVSLPTVYATPEEQFERRQRAAAYQAIGVRAALPQVDKQPERQNDYLALSMVVNLATSVKIPETLREKQGLTDRVQMTYEPRLASGALFIEATALPENDQRVRDAAIAVMQTLAAAQTTDDDFEQGRNAAIGRYSIAMQQHAARAMEYARAVMLGRKPSDVDSQPDLIRNVRKTDLRRVAEGALKSGQPGRGGVRPN